LAQGIKFWLPWPWQGFGPGRMVKPSWSVTGRPRYTWTERLASLGAKLKGQKVVVASATIPADLTPEQRSTFLWLRGIARGTLTAKERSEFLVARYGAAKPSDVADARKVGVHLMITTILLRHRVLLQYYRLPAIARQQIARRKPPAVLTHACLGKGLKKHAMFKAPPKLRAATYPAMEDAASSLGDEFTAVLAERLAKVAEALSFGRAESVRAFLCVLTLCTYSRTPDFVRSLTKDVLARLENRALAPGWLWEWVAARVPAGKSAVGPCSSICHKPDSLTYDLATWSYEKVCVLLQSTLLAESQVHVEVVGGRHRLCFGERFWTDATNGTPLLGNHALGSRPETGYLRALVSQSTALRFLSGAEEDDLFNDADDDDEDGGDSDEETSEATVTRRQKGPRTPAATSSKANGWEKVFNPRVLGGAQKTWAEIGTEVRAELVALRRDGLTTLEQRDAATVETLCAAEGFIAQSAACKTMQRCVAGVDLAQARRLCRTEQLRRLLDQVAGSGVLLATE
jgi:hypothetical protein